MSDYFWEDRDVSGEVTAVERRELSTFDRASKFIKEVGFPVAVAVGLLAYVWFVGVKTNEAIVRSDETMRRVISLIERMEPKLK